MAEQKKRVVVTGIGVIAPKAHGKEQFEKNLREGISGISHVSKMEEAGFACNVGGIPPDWREIAPSYFSEDQMMSINELLAYAGIASIDAWKDAGLEVTPPGEDTVHWDTGVIIGIGQSDLDTVTGIIDKIRAGKVKRMGSTVVEQTMTSAPSALISGLLALGGEASTVSSACTTGTDAIIRGVRSIQNGEAKRIVAGGVDTTSLVNWGGFDSMKVINRTSNDQPEKASRPLSASAAGFVPGAGAGVLILEELETALARGAHIYAEALGGHLNGGGHRMGGSMTLPNAEGVRRAVLAALADANIEAKDIDLINGHLTGTIADPLEVGNWSKALNLAPEDFPRIQATKSLIGHCLGAAGGVEGVAVMLQLDKGFMHGSLNCEDLHPELQSFEKSVVRKTEETQPRIVAKSSFGFGDVNGITIWKKWEG